MFSHLGQELSLPWRDPRRRFERLPTLAIVERLEDRTLLKPVSNWGLEEITYLRHLLRYTDGTRAVASEVRGVEGDPGHRF